MSLLLKQLSIIMGLQDRERQTDRLAERWTHRKERRLTERERGYGRGGGGAGEGESVFAGCLMSQQHASVSQGWICSDKSTCCHTETSCKSNIPSHPVRVYWQRANQSQHWPYSARRLAGYPLECQCLSHWYDLTPEKSRLKQDSNLGSSALEVDALTTRPTR